MMMMITITVTIIITIHINRNEDNDLKENAHGRPRLDRYKLLSGTICVHRQVPQDLHQVTDQENGTKPLSGNGA